MGRTIQNAARCFAYTALAACAGLCVSCGPANRDSDSSLTAIQRLENESTRPLDMHRRNGFPRVVSMEVASPGEDPVAQAQSFIERHRAFYLQVSDDAGLQVQQVLSAPEEDGQFVKFSQTYRDIPVYGGELVVQVHQDRIVSTAGALLAGKAALDPVPNLGPRAATERAVNSLGLSTDSDIAPLAEPTLFVFDPRILDEDAFPAPRLVWRVVLPAPALREVLVDAYNGEIVRSASYVQSDGAATQGIDFEIFHGLNLDVSGGGCVPGFLFPPALQIATENATADEFLNDPVVLTTRSIYSQTYSFYHQSFNAHSDFYFDDPVSITIFVNGPTGPDDFLAFYNRSCDQLMFSNSALLAPVMTHEFTHAVIARSSEILSGGQSGAVNEGFADAIAWVHTRGVPDSLRHVIEPSGSVPSDPQCPPGTTYVSHVDNLFTGSCDDGGEHINSTLLSHPAWTMLRGKTFTDNSFVPPATMQVPSMDPTKVAGLYHAVMLTSAKATNLRDTARRLIYRAQLYQNHGLHGFTADDACSVINAFALVGLSEPDYGCDGTATSEFDTDGDAVPDTHDNCPDIPNPNQQDKNYNGLGTACDPSEDGDLDDDGVPDADDNCPNDYNPDQQNTDAALEQIAAGDACDPDNDGDGISNDNDNCPFTDNADQANADGDGAGDACDRCPDEDDVIAWSRGLYNPELGIEVDPEPLQPDFDGDGIPNACDDSFRFAGVRGIATGGMGADFDRAVMAAVDVDMDSSRLQLPLAVCEPPDEQTWYPPTWRQIASFEQVPEGLNVDVVDSRGFIVSRPGPVEGNIEFSFHPRSNERYWLTLSHGEDTPVDQSVAFRYAFDCGNGT